MCVVCCVLCSAVLCCAVLWCGVLCIVSVSVFVCVFLTVARLADEIEVNIFKEKTDVFQIWFKISMRVQLPVTF